MSVFKQEVVVLSAKYWRMEEGGYRDGVTVWYLPTADLNPTVNGSDNFGIQPCKVSVPATELRAVSVCPGIYECELDLKPAGGGKLQLQPSKFVYKSDLWGLAPETK